MKKWMKRIIKLFLIMFIAVAIGTGYSGAYDGSGEPCSSCGDPYSIAYNPYSVIFQCPEDSLGTYHCSTCGDACMFCGLGTSGEANAPVLVSGLTPVNWNGYSWVTTSEANWDYNYDRASYVYANYGSAKWANAKTADGSLYVWIPRFTYWIPSGYEESEYGAILIHFSDGTDDYISADATASAASGFTSHPAFTLGDTELTGFWVMKYKASQSGSTLQSKPNQTPYTSTSFDTLFNLGYNLNRNLDSHMIKNTEWGAIAYLTAAIGAIPNQNSTGETGGGSDSLDGSDWTDEGEWNTELGMMASTTRNEYGVYDMNMMTPEVVASKYVTTSPSTSSTQFKYMNYYTDKSGLTHINPWRGDALSETSNVALGSWYGGPSVLLTSNTLLSSAIFKEYYTRVDGMFGYRPLTNMASATRVVLTPTVSTTYTVTFNSNGGTGTMSSQTFADGIAQNLSANTFTRSGYTFIGWNTAADGSGTSFTDGQSFTITHGSSMTLYAQWNQTGTVPIGKYVKYSAGGINGPWKVVGKNGDVLTLVNGGINGDSSEFEYYTIDALWSNTSGTVSQQKTKVANLLPIIQDELDDFCNTTYVTGIAESARSATVDDLSYIEEYYDNNSGMGSYWLNTESVEPGSVQGSPSTNCSAWTGLQAVWYSGGLSITDEYLVFAGSGALLPYDPSTWSVANQVFPIVTTKSGLTIKSGTGTYNDPYVLGEPLTTCTITATAGIGGTISPSGTITVQAGASQAFRISPEEGYEVVEVKVDGNAVETFLIYDSDIDINQDGREDVNDVYLVNNYINGSETLTEQQKLMADFNRDGTIDESDAVVIFRYIMLPDMYQDARYIDINGDGVGDINDAYLVNNYINGSETLTEKQKLMADFNGDGTIDISDALAIQRHTTLPKYYPNTRVRDRGYIFTNVTSDHTITVSFESNTYAITATAGTGGTITPSGTITVQTGASQSFRISPEEDHEVVEVKVDGNAVETFLIYENGVDINQDGSENTDDGTLVESYINGNATLTEQQKLMADFDGDGVIEEEDATRIFLHTMLPEDYPNTRVRDRGIIFYSVTSDHTITVTFVSEAAPTYTVTFNNNNGSGTMEAQEFEAGVAEALKANTFTKTGHTFRGWNTAQDGSGTEYEDQQVITITGNMTLYAQWRVNNYTIEATAITADAGEGGTISPSGNVSVTHGSSKTFTITPNTYYEIYSVKIDRSLISTGSLANGTGNAKTYTFSNVTANHTIEVTFERKICTVTYYGNGATSGSMGIQDFDAGIADTLRTNAYSRTNYTFAGWNTKADGTGTTYANGQSVILTGDLELYAQWGNTPCTVTFNSNGGSGTMANQTFYAGVPQALNANTFTYTGSTFSGWNTAANGSGTSYSDGQSITITSSITLYAQWGINSYTITATAGEGGTISPSGTTTVPYRATQAYIITPEEGYEIANVIVDETSVIGSLTGTGDAKTYTFSSITANHTIAATFRVKTYTIEATAGTGGTISPSGTTWVSYRSRPAYTITPNEGYEIADVTVDGTSVIGSLTGTGDAKTYTFSSITANHTIAVTFRVKTYTIEATAGTGGTISPSGTTSVPYRSRPAYTITPDEGYEIADVTVDGTSVIDALTGTGATKTYTFSSITANHTIVATFTRIKYTVTFDGNGATSGTMSNQEFEAGVEEALTANAYSRTYYTFSGWNTAANGSGTSYTNNQSVTLTGNLTLYAQWTRIQYTVTFDGNGATSGTMSNQTFNAGVAQALTANAYSRTYYTFNGWNTAANGSGTSYADRASVTLTSGNLTLYAQWTRITYTVTFDGNNATSGTMSNQTFNAGEAQNLTANAYSRTHYTFNGWNTAANGSGTSYANRASVTLTSGNLTLYAQWKKDNYTITVTQGANGTITPGTTSVEYEEDITFTITPNEHFKIATVKVDGSSVAVSSLANGTGNAKTYTFSNVSDNHTIKVTFEIITYTVAYDGNGATSGTMITQIFEAGVPKALKANAYTKTGHTFNGWNTVANGSGISYTDGESVTLTSGSITLYAQWSQNKYTITWKNYDGTVLEVDQEVPYGETPSYDYEHSGTPTREATAEYTYSFSGWDPAIVPVTGNATYTARFDNPEVNTYTVIWKNYDGTVLETDSNISYGETPSYNSATPTRSSDAQYRYIFKGWIPTGSIVTGDAVYTADFTAIPQEYTVTWKNYDGTVLRIDTNVPYGTVPSYNGITPTRVPDSQYSYVFEKWTPDIMAIAGDTIYTAMFTPVPQKYKVVWKNHDGAVLETDVDVEYGTIPTYDGATPTKPETDLYRYAFSSWTPVISSVTGDASYTAEFVQELKKIGWTWISKEGSTKTISMTTKGQATIHWGDGKVDNIKNSSNTKFTLTHEYLEAGTYNVEVHGDVINYLDISNTNVTSGNFTMAASLNELFIYKNSINSLAINSLNKVVTDNGVSVNGSATKILKVGTVGPGTFTVNDNLVINFTTARIYKITAMTKNGSSVSPQASYNAGGLNGTNTIIATFGLNINPTNEPKVVSWDWDVSETLTREVIAKVPQDTVILWGDGSYDVVLSGNSQVLTHTYSATGTYTAGFIDSEISELNISDSKVTSINVKNAISLEKLNISDNDIKDFDLSANIALVELKASGNDITTVDLTNNSKLEKLVVENNDISVMKLSSLAPLKYLDVTSNKFETLDVSMHSSLVTLKCGKNGITSLNLGTIGTLKVLDVSYNELSSLNVSYSEHLEELYCNYNNLETLDLRNNIKLKVLRCENNKIPVLDVTDMTDLLEIRAFNNEITALDLNNNNNLELAIVDLDSNARAIAGKSILRLKAYSSGYIDAYNYVTLNFIPEIGYKVQRVALNDIDQAISNTLILGSYKGDNTVEVWFTAGSPSNEVVVNIPRIVDGMIPVKWNGSKWIITVQSDPEWYNYSKDKMMWANVMLRDGAKYMKNGVSTNIGNTELSSLFDKEVDNNNMGSMFVWIPRFTYKIDGSNIEVKFSDGLDDYTNGDYILHPAFTFASYLGGETDKYYDPNADEQLTGFWVGKYEASNTGSALTTKGSARWTGLTVGQAFTNSKNMFESYLGTYLGSTVATALTNSDTLYNSHLMKNVEWGAVAYLSKALGSYDTASTTNNETGIYNMNRGLEFVASYIELVGGISNFNVRDNGAELLDYAVDGYTPTDDELIRYVDKVKLTSPYDEEDRNLIRLRDYLGIAVNEISENEANIPNKDHPFFVRGNSSIFDYEGATGEGKSTISFRPAIIAEGEAAYVVTHKIESSATAYGTIDPLGTVNVIDGGSRKFIITPASGAEIVDVKVDGVSKKGQLATETGTSKSYTFSNITGNHTIHAIFDKPIASYNVIGSVAELVDSVIIDNPAVGSIIGTGTCNSRSTVTLKANSTPGYEFVSWEVIENTVTLADTTSATISFVMPSNNVKLKAVFKKAAVQLLTVEMNEVKFESYENIGKDITVEATVSSGYVFDYWTATGITLSTAQRTATSISFKMPTNDVTLVANYKEAGPTTYTIAVTQGTNGTINPGTTAVTEGSNVTFTIAPNSGYVLSDVIIDGNFVSASSLTAGIGNSKTYTFSNVTSNHTIEAIFNNNGASTNNIANAPVLIDGLTPVNWNGSSWATTTTSNWDYNYNSVADAIQSTVTGNGDGKWANAMTADGSMYVWIPRYSYKIESGENQENVKSWNSLDDPGTGSAAGKISIKFSNGTSDDTTGDYIAHPAFTFGSDELTGIWVAKYVEGKPDSGVASNPSIGPAFSAAYDTFRAADSHLMKNTEWGAVAYLTNAIGRTPYANPYICSGYAAPTQEANGGSDCYLWNTATGVKGSTTHNVYGIYDMSTVGEGEYVAAYLDVPGLEQDTYFGPLVQAYQSTGTRYVDVYPISGDGSDAYANYSLWEGIMYGDAICETSTYISSLEAYVAWDNDQVWLPYEDPMGFVGFARGGSYSFSDDETSGIYAVNYACGYTAAGYGARVVLAPESTSNSGGTSQNYTITVTQGSNGTISPGTSTVTSGTNKTFTITPNSGYKISTLKVDGSSKSVTNSAGMTYTFSNVTSNHTITATFTATTSSNYCTGTGYTCYPTRCTAECPTCGGNGIYNCYNGLVVCDAGCTVGWLDCYHDNTTTSTGVCNSSTCMYNLEGRTTTITCNDCGKWSRTCDTCDSSYSGLDSPQINGKDCPNCDGGSIAISCPTHPDFVGAHQVMCDCDTTGEPCTIHGISDIHYSCAHYDYTELTSHSYCTHGNTETHYY